MHLLMKGTYFNTYYKCHFRDNYTECKIFFFFFFNGATEMYLPGLSGAGSTEGLHSGPWKLNQTHKADRLLVSTLREQQNGTRLAVTRIQALLSAVNRLQFNYY